MKLKMVGNSFNWSFVGFPNKDSHPFRFFEGAKSSPLLIVR